MCAVDYVHILNSVMLTLTEEEVPIKWEFMQYSDPKHPSKLANKYLQQNKINVMEWPSQSPGLNPIEHLWGILKRRIGDCKTKKKDELWSKIQREWYSIPVETCAELVNSMGRTVEAVINNKSATTKYSKNLKYFYR